VAALALLLGLLWSFDRRARHLAVVLRHAEAQTQESLEGTFREYWGAGKVEGAEGVATLATATYPNWPQGYIWKYKVRDRQGKKEEGLPYLVKAAKLGADSVRPLLFIEGRKKKDIALVQLGLELAQCHPMIAGDALSLQAQAWIAMRRQVERVDTAVAAGRRGEALREFETLRTIKVGAIDVAEMAQEVERLGPKVDSLP
jgi:hypothetical protein